MSSVDWFSYFLHPDRLREDFGHQSSTPRWSSPGERRTAGIHVLRGLLGTSNFREFVISAYPAFRDAHGQRLLSYSGPTPPSTPISPSVGGLDTTDIKSISRIGQCSRFSMSPDTGLPKERLAAVIKSSELPELSARQQRLLSVARDLAALVGFDVEEVEMAVHATIRFIYYLHLLETATDDEHRSECEFQYRRWTVRSAYREEDIGLTMEVAHSSAMQVNCRKLEAYAESLDQSNEQAKSLKYRVAYDLARVYLAQSEFARALDMFRQCQQIDPMKGRTDKFGLASRQGKPSVDEYVASCAAIVQSLSDNSQSAADTGGSHGELEPPRSRHEQMMSLVAAGEYSDALSQCLIAALEEEANRNSYSENSYSWLLCIHPKLLHHCAKQTPSDIDEIRNALFDTAAAWIESAIESGMLGADDRDEMETRATAVIMFVTGDAGLTSLGPAMAPSAYGPRTDSTSGASSTEATMLVDSGDDANLQERQRATIAEDQQMARESLSFETPKAPLAMLKVSYSYLSGLRLLEKEQYGEAQIWFSRASSEIEAFPTGPQAASGPVMASQAEKDRALKVALTSQVAVHTKLAQLFYQIEQGAEVDDLSEDIDGILEAQTPVRFEFLEHLVLICLRQDNKSVFTSLVSTIATNQKLYQQLPEIHITLLQVASLLVVVRDVLLAAGIEVDRAVRETTDTYRIDLEAISPEQLEQLQKSVADIAAFLLKIPIGSRAGSAMSLRTEVGCVPQVGSGAENEIERFCRMWGDPVYLTILAALLSEMLQPGEPVSGPLSLCGLVSHIVRRPDGAEDKMGVHENKNNGSGSGSGSGVKGESGGSNPTQLRSVADEFINSKSDQGRSNTKHLHDIALVVLRQAARAVPKSAAVWLYFSLVASSGKLEGQFMPLYIEYLNLHTEMFSPALLSDCMEQQWFQRQLPEMIRSLVGLGLSGAAAVLHQCSADVNYEAAMPLIVQAFEKKEIDQRVAEFFWDPNMIEYGQYLGRLQSSAVHVEFAVPSEELEGTKPLVLSEFFFWLSGVLSLK
ncbi:hypothetical protein GQ54DRAFT_312701 [Martensiomyces pterosporus]|nr:hypothetical protein GQ54DRAFT_312701 [Martensiomyces pterosporus]